MITSSSYGTPYLFLYENAFRVTVYIFNKYVIYVIEPFMDTRHFLTKHCGSFSEPVCTHRILWGWYVSMLDINATQIF